jgi:predicted DsbA family dithiol-disulfide isomerase
MHTVTAVVYSDFLCPWCYNAYTKLEAVRAELPFRVELQWRSFLLRPVARPGRDLEKFRAYTESWRRVAADEPRASFRVWAGTEAPPSHSLPAHLVAKAAEALGADAATSMRERLFRAYFTESRDISSETTLRKLWRDLALPERAFEERERWTDRVESDHREAVDCGATGVPAVRLATQEFVVMGAQPEAVYRRWFERARAHQLEEKP